MYKHILLPTDGSALSEIAIANGLQFARAVGARVTGFYVIVQRAPESFEDYAPASNQAPPAQELGEQEARKCLGTILRKAGEAGVPCEQHSMVHASPHQAIIQAATEKGCDLIVMASHGRKGITGDLVGSETARVITHCKIPVLVYR